MSTFGMVVEGAYDEAALTEIIRTCVEGEIEVIGRPCFGSIISKFRGFLEEFRYANQGSPVDKALVIMDANGKDADQLIERAQERITNRKYPFPVKIVVIIRELESWLLADETAISSVTVEYSGRTAPRVNEPPEEIVAPKERLTGLLSGAGVYYTAEVARRIAAAVDIERLSYRCPGFTRFREAVTDC